MADLKEIRNQRGKAIADARAILDKVDGEKRAITEDESKQYESLIAESQRLKDTIAREERQQELDREAAELALRDEKKEYRKEDRKIEKSVSPLASDEYRNAFLKFCVAGPAALNGDEARALSAGTSTQGGYLLMPEQMVDGILKGVDDAVFIRQKATKFRVPAATSLGVPTMTADAADADWTTELATGSEDSTLAFGKRALYPQKPIAKRIKISNELLQRLPGIEAFVRSRLEYKFAITHEKAFMTGSGAGQPLGLFTASNSGISTGRDVSTGNTITYPTFDGLTEAKYTLKGQYWNRADWMFHRDCLKVLAKIKDGDGQYIWRESVRAGEPDTLLGRPVQMSEYVPNTMTTQLYVGILGDFSYYWIADALDMTIQRLVELYAETNQTGLIGRMSSDGMPVLEEAFVRIKLA
jgi:HK97 family phage major capsid protein